MHFDDEMQMFGHDDIVLNLYHRIEGRDGVEQLVLHHLPDGRQRRMRRIGAAVGGGEGSHDGTEGLPEALCHMQGDVVDAGEPVVMSRCAAGHAVLCGIALFHLVCHCGKTAAHELLFE